MGVPVLHGPDFSPRANLRMLALEHYLRTVDPTNLRAVAVSVSSSLSYDVGSGRVIISVTNTSGSQKTLTLNGLDDLPVGSTISVDKPNTGDAVQVTLGSGEFVDGSSSHVLGAGVKDHLRLMKVGADRYAILV